MIEGKVLHLTIDAERYQYQELQPLEPRPLGGGVMQLRYAMRRP